jgi:hypothetical protein
MLHPTHAVMWAPHVCLILLRPGSYICDWRNFVVNEGSDSTSPDVSFYEREISYDSFGGNFFLGDEIIIGVWPNPFRNQIQK